MFSRTRELWYSLAAMIVVTALYLVPYRQLGAPPPPAGFVGHGIGVLGIALMLLAETLYSVRKRVASASWGSTASWLRFHIFAGLVGPYMVLLHSAMQFHGIAGVAMLLTVVVVASGVVGRYVFTMAPQPEAALDVGAPTGIRSPLAVWRSVHVPLTWVLFAAAFAHAIGALYYATFQR